VSYRKHRQRDTAITSLDAIEAEVQRPERADCTQHFTVYTKRYVDIHSAGVHMLMVCRTALSCVAAPCLWLAIAWLLRATAAMPPWLFALEDN